MKKIIFCLFSLAILSSCRFQEPEENRFKQLSFLEGKWSAYESGRQVFEEWHQINDTLFTGSGYEIKNDVAHFFEYLSLRVSKDGIYYGAAVNGKDLNMPVFFKLNTDIKDSFVFINYTHDFPKKIIYQTPVNDSMKVTLVGDENSGQIINYLFIKEKSQPLTQ